MNHDVYRNHYAAGAFLHVTRDGDWVILHTASGGSETTLSVPKSDAMQAAWTMSPQLDDLFTENRALRQAAYELGTCRQTYIEALRSIADEIDCGPDCDDGYVEHDTNAHICTRENRGDDCAFYRACNLRELATALETTSALASSNASPGATEAGPLQPGSEPSGAFTPGPWTARQEYSNRWRIEAMPYGKDHIPITTALVVLTALEVGFGPDEQIAANARLIAAAPDQHAALLSAPVPSMFHGPQGFDVEGFLNSYEDWSKLKRAAIAKATPTPTLAGEGEG